eukprot:scaffold207840_cov28-Tisochrysis_lutea.AAC.3
MSSADSSIARMPGPELSRSNESSNSSSYGSIPALPSPVPAPLRPPALPSTARCPTVVKLAAFRATGFWSPSGCNCGPPDVRANMEFPPPPADAEGVARGARAGAGVGGGRAAEPSARNASGRESGSSKALTTVPTSPW